MKATIIFIPLKIAKHLKVFGITAGIIAATYLAFSIIIGTATLKPFPSGNWFDIMLFGALRSFSSLTTFDWVILALFPLVGGLLFANYSYWRCSPTKSGKAGLIAGLVAATCPVCIFPIIGIAAIATSLAVVATVIKVAGLLVLIGATYAVALKDTKCKISLK